MDSRSEQEAIRRDIFNANRQTILRAAETQYRDKFTKFRKRDELVETLTDFYFFKHLTLRGTRITEYDVNVGLSTEKCPNKSFVPYLERVSPALWGEWCKWLAS